MENEPHANQLPEVAEDTLERAATDPRAAEEGRAAPVDVGLSPFEAPSFETGPRPRRSGADAGAGAALAEAGSAAGPPGEGSFGAWLRRQREIREIDLREIADKTKISMRYLKAMEQDRFEVLPAPIFARGFLREYAKYVGLDADEVVNYYLAAHNPAGSDDEDGTLAGSPGRRPAADGRGPLNRRSLILFLVVLVLAALAYWYFYQRSRDVGDRPRPPIATPAAFDGASPGAGQPVAVAAEGGVAAAPPPPGETVPEPPRAPLVVTFDFTEKCWLEVQVDGGRRLSRNYVAGESLQLEAERRVTLETVGNVAGVEVQVNGEPFALPARGTNRTAHGVVIDLEPADG